MNSRDRVRLALTCGRPDRIPKALSFFNQSLASIAPSTVEEYFGLDIQYVGFAAPPELSGFTDYLQNLPSDIHVGNVNQLKTYHEWRYHPELNPGGPLTFASTVHDLQGFVFPDLSDPSRHAGLAARVRALQDAGYAVAGSPPHLGGELFESAWRLRGFDTFMTDLLRRKGLANYLLDQLTAMMIHGVLVLAEAGIDILLLDDDIAMPTGLMVSLGTWREFFAPRLGDVINLGREVNRELLIFYHSDGDFAALIPDLVRLGVNVINPVQPDCMNGPAIKAEFGHRLAMWGTLGTASLWDHGTPDQIRAEVRKRIETLGPEGLLLAPAYDIDFTPLENLIAFSEAVEEYGRIS